MVCEKINDEENSLLQTVSERVDICLAEFFRLVESQASRVASKHSLLNLSISALGLPPHPEVRDGKGVA